MEGTGAHVSALTLGEIVEVNRRVLHSIAHEPGRSPVVVNENSLLHIVGAWQATFEG